MLAKGFDVDIIAEISKLSTEEIKTLWHRKLAQVKSFRLNKVLWHHTLKVCCHKMRRKPLPNNQGQATVK
jgi:hypothetical protein